MTSSMLTVKFLSELLYKLCRPILSYYESMILAERLYLCCQLIETLKMSSRGHKNCNFVRVSLQWVAYLGTGKNLLRD